MKTGIALGSNLGDRLHHLRAARDFLLTLHEGSAPATFSPVYQTTPVDCPPGSPSFLNAVVEIDTPLHPASLLPRLHALERELGRPARHAENSPRTIDLDILYAGELVLDLPGLTVPHPRLAQRRFVLQPLADLRPSMLLPGHTGAIAALLAALTSQPGVEIFARDW